MTDTPENTETVPRARYIREKAAREQAEDLLENKSLELYMANQSLEDAVRKAKNDSARVNAIMNSMKDIAIATDEQLNIHDANIQAIMFLGKALPDLKDQSLLQMLPVSNPPQYQDLIREFLDENSEVQDIEIFFNNDDQTCFELSISSFQHNDETYLLHILRDISRRKVMMREQQRMEGELAQAAKWEAVGQLAGGIAHEINTPSQYIGDNLKFLSDSSKDVFAILEKALALKVACNGKEEYASLVAGIDEAIEEYDLPFLLEELPLAFQQSSEGIAQVSRIVLAMKNFSHPGTEDKEPIDINQAIDTTLTVSRNEWKTIASLETDFDETIGAVKCIPGAMNQVFLNLIVNAAHAIADHKNGAQGELKVSTKKLDDQVEIRISDTGGGIPEEHQAKIFDPFFTTKDV
ncbi:PAS domain-containing sensor histidine kinase, partial [Curvivirga aplysinae]|uniref:PAS domain-containing sensor histidine kinase n=1 Tax=Curvivirga aplysinae TaxID=2529852 RepID=UPI0012BC9E0A